MKAVFSFEMYGTNYPIHCVVCQKDGVLSHIAVETKRLAEFICAASRLISERVNGLYGMRMRRHR